MASQCCLALKVKTSQFITSVVLEIMSGLISDPKVLHWAQEMNGLSSGRDPSTQVAWQMSHSLLHICDYVYVHRGQHFPSLQRKSEGEFARTVFQNFVYALPKGIIGYRPAPSLLRLKKTPSDTAAGQILNLLPR